MSIVAFSPFIHSSFITLKQLWWKNQQKMSQNLPLCWDIVVKWHSNYCRLCSHFILNSLLYSFRALNFRWKLTFNRLHFQKQTSQRQFCRFCYSFSVAGNCLGAPLWVFRCLEGKKSPLFLAACTFLSLSFCKFVFAATIWQEGFLYSEQPHHNFVMFLSEALCWILQQLRYNILTKQKRLCTISYFALCSPYLELFCLCVHHLINACPRTNLNLNCQNTKEKPSYHCHWSHTRKTNPRP